MEDDFTSNGDLGVAALVRSLIKALEAQGRGFAHGHEKTHSEPRTKAIDLLRLFHDSSDSSAAEHGNSRAAALSSWMEAHRVACLRDTATKQYDSSVESARQFGCHELKEVFTAEERTRCRLDGGQEEDGSQRDDVEVIATPEPAHVLRERDMAVAEGRAVRHSYKGTPLTGAPGARFPQYLLPHQFDRYPDLDTSGHAPETLDAGAPENDGCATGWIDVSQVYVTGPNGSVVGFRKENGEMASAEELQAEARRYSRNYAADARFCHVYNHTHVCKATCFKRTQYKKPSETGEKDASTTRGSCRFRFWRLVTIAERVWRRMGKALVREPAVASANDANNEYGRCQVRRENCFRGSSSDLCQVCLRCNVDLQHQVRTFPDQDEPAGAATNSLSGFLGLLAGRARSAKDTAVRLLSSFAIAMRSSHVADFYATKYLAKPQQWLTNVLGPLIAGLRRMEEKKDQVAAQLQTKAQALRNVRTAIFAANRSIWISCCEACLYLHTGSSAVQSHLDVVVHARKGLFMMHECQRILNKEVAGEGLWQADLARSSEEAAGDCMQIRTEAAGDADDSEPEDSDSAEDASDQEEASDSDKEEKVNLR